MVPTEAVLAVIRASRPELRSAHDRVAFALHATFLASGYSLAATGSQALSAPSSGLEDREVGIDGWNLLENAYAFRYFTEEKDFVKHVDVRCMVINDLLMVDVAPIGENAGSDLLHLEIRVTEYAKEESVGSYGQQYKDLDGLVKLLSSQILMKCMKNRPPAPATRDHGKSLVADEPGRTTCGNPLPGGVTPGVGVYQGPRIGFDDLLPGAGAGIFEPRNPGFESGEAGNVLGPRHPIFGPDPLAPTGVPPRPGSGIRHDPFGPPGVPGFEPNRFGRGDRDIQHFPPP